MQTKLEATGSADLPHHLLTSSVPLQKVPRLPIGSVLHLPKKTFNVSGKPLHTKETPYLDLEATYSGSISRLMLVLFVIAGVWRYADCEHVVPLSPVHAVLLMQSRSLESARIRADGGYSVKINDRCRSSIVIKAYELQVSRNAVQLEVR